MSKFIKRRDGDRGGGREPEPRDRRERGDNDADRPPDSNGHGNGDSQASQWRPRTSAAKAIAQAKEYVYELTGQEPEAVSGLSFGERGWKVTLDVVEMERVPRTTDVMASYELELDEQGELTGYRRLGRYYRSQVDQG